MIEYTGGAYNMDFLVNCVLWLSGEDDLLRIKNKGVSDMSLNRITDEAEFLSARTAVLAVNLAVIPLLVCVLFVIVRLNRRR